MLGGVGSTPRVKLVRHVSDRLNLLKLSREVELVRHVGDRLNLFDFSKCGGVGGDMPVLNKACSLTTPQIPKWSDGASASRPPTTADHNKQS